MAQKKQELPFNIHKYQPAPKNNRYTDGAGALANQLSHVISFRNIRNDEDVLFKAFIMDFNESYSPNFTPNEVFGRTDPIYQYKNTTRSISLSFKIPASTESEAFENLGRVQKLIQMLYPSYQSTNSGLSLSEAPLVRLKVMNILRSQASMAGEDDPFKPDANYFTEYTSTADPGKGLLGVIVNATVNSMLSSADGVFNKLTTIPAEGEDPAVTKAEPNTVLPKLIEVTINFAPIHEETLGYIGADDETPIGNFARFPYGVQLAPASLDTKRMLPPSVSEAVAQQRTEAEKQRKAASAQQEEDKKKSKSTKLFNKANRKQRRVDRRQGRIDRRQGALDERQTEVDSLMDQAYDAAVEEGIEAATGVDYGEFMTA